MSETIDIRVYLNAPLLPVPAIERFEIMGSEVSRHLADIRQTGSNNYSYTSVNIHSSSQTPGLFQTKTKAKIEIPQHIHTQNLIPVNVKPIPLPTIPIPKPGQNKIKTGNMDKIEKLVAVAKTLEATKLSDLRSEVEQKMPELNKIVEKAVQFLKSSKRMNSRAQVKEFSRYYEKLLQIIVSFRQRCVGPKIFFSYFIPDLFPPRFPCSSMVASIGVFP